MNTDKNSDKKDYSKTVFLPKTSFSMRGDLPNKEPARIKEWEESGLYKKILNKNRGNKPYILHDGPPYANGEIHLGHALNKILKDIAVKSHAVMGYYTPYTPGWDCHGLPIEQALLKEMKMGKRHISDIPAFRQKAREFAMRFVNKQREGFKRLGVLADWDDPYITMSKDYEGTVIKAFRELKEKGYIHRDKKTIHWCLSCETALADAEVEYKDISSPSVYVKFRLQNLPGKFPAEILGKTYIVIWTTTPWTLPANMAAAVAAEEEYALLEADNGDCLIVADKLAETFMKETGVSAVKKDSVPGKDLVGLKYTHCLTSHLPDRRRFPRTVISTDFVEMSTGTGIVHIAPGHGEDDFFAGKKWGLEIFCPVKEDGTFNDDAGEFKGMKVFEANDIIIDTLKKDGLLIARKDIKHSYPHCWRCKKPIIFRATEQWFFKVDLENLRSRLLLEADKVTWKPETGKARMEGMLKTRPDWCLSRQRYWGTPIIAAYCKECGKVYDDAEFLKSIEDRVFREGSDFWFSEPIEKLMGNRTCSCGSRHFRKETDIMDVWLDSGVSWYAVIKNRPLYGEKYLPVDLYLEGSDQHRGWFQTSLIPSVTLRGVPPFKTVLTHGMVLDEEGHPMHKSAGNSVSPQQISQKYGAEILRLWAALCDYSDDVKISEKLLSGPVDTYRKLRNTFRYLLGNLSDFRPGINDVKYADMPETDKYMLARLSVTAENVKTAYLNYQFRQAIRQITDFCILDLSAFYLDLLKDRMYTLAPDCMERRSAQTVLYNILTSILPMAAPVLSFTAEEAWQAARKDINPKLPESVFLADYPELPAEWKDAGLLSRWQQIMSVREKITAEIEKIRQKGTVGSSLEAAIKLRSSSKPMLSFLNSVGESQWKAIAIVSDCKIEEDPSAEPVTVVAEKTSGSKCPRCWQYRKDIGSDPEYPDLCGRCAEVMKRQ